MQKNDHVVRPGEISSVDIASTLSQRKGIIILCVLVTVGAALGISLSTKPTYRATTKVLLRQEKLAPGNIFPAYSTGEEFLKGQAQIIQGEPIISEALKDKTFLEELDQSNQVLNIASARKGVSADFISRTNILRLNVEHTDPLFTASLANAIVRVYTDYRTALKEKLIDESMRAINKQIKIEENQLARAQKALETYSRKEQIAILPESQIVVDLKRFSGFDAEIMAVNTDLQSLNTRIYDLKEQVANNHLETLILPVLLESPAVNGFQSNIRTIETELSELLTEYTLEHPDVINAQNKLERLRKDIKDERRKVVAAEIGSLEMQKKLLEGERDILFNAAATQGARLNKVLFSQPKLSQLLEDVNTKRSSYRGTLGQQRSLTLFREKSKHTPDIQIIETAKVPLSPIKPDIPLNSLLGLVVGLCLGCGIALALPVSAAKQKERRVTIGREKREMIRAGISTEVIYNVLGKPQIKHKCLSRDISGSGIGLTTDEKLSKEAILELKINIPESGVISAKGEVVWISEISLREDGKGPFSAGVKFIDINLNDHQKITEYIDKNMELSKKRNV